MQAPANEADGESIEDACNAEEEGGESDGGAAVRRSRSSVSPAMAETSKGASRTRL